jgi:hypothetical protein
MRGIGAGVRYGELLFYAGTDRAQTASKSKRIRPPRFADYCVEYVFKFVLHISVRLPWVGRGGTRMHPRVGPATPYVIEMVECQLFICVCHCRLPVG